LYFTGNKQHNINLRKIAIKKGLKLSEYGVFNKKNNKKVAYKTEERIYKKLGLSYIEPELRENRGEIEAALREKLPKLINYNQLRGDLHIHSNYSDGSNSIEEIVEAAKKMNYSYIAITDHSETQKIGKGLSESKLMRKIKEIEKINKKFKDLKILKSAEVDIKKDGSLDYKNSILKKLDFVIVSIHSGFKMAPEKMTARVVKAIENEYVNLFAHPTGRLITERAPYDINLDKIFEVAKERKVALEINSHPNRLDLKDVHVKRAIDFGVKLIINTDSHNINNLKFIELGIATARRGWAQKKDILNTLNFNKFIKSIKK
jgi:DNA polymerase (family 10)